ncbi:MAG: ABC transporter permease [Anaerolineales bacterium]
MQRRRLSSMAMRVVTQIRRDHRSVALIFVVPMVVMGLLGYIVRLDTGPQQIGVVVNDSGMVLPTGVQVVVAEELLSALSDREDIAFRELDLNQAEAELIEGSLDAVLIFPEDLSGNLLAGEGARLEIVVEGSNPGQAQAIPLALNAALGLEALALRPSGPALDLEMETRYLFAGEQYDFLDSFGPVYITVFVYFFVFMLTGVSFLRERTQGTMERLFATPIARAEIALGYMFGFGMFALVQSAVILFFTTYVVQIQNVGNLALVSLLLGVLAIGAVNLGIFLSTYARTELQVIQFIPVVIIPQILLSGLIVPVDNLPRLLKFAARLMPLTYANRAVTDVMIRGYGLGEVAMDLLILSTFAVGALILSATTLRRQFI